MKTTKLKERIADVIGKLKHEWKIWREITKLKLAMKVTSKWHAEMRKNCTNNKNLVFYIVLLERPIVDKKKRIFRKEEKLFWISRRNFQAIKRKGWLPGKMTCDQLRYNCFYYTDPRRSYVGDQYAKAKAIERYREYLGK